MKDTDFGVIFYTVNAWPYSWNFTYIQGLKCLCKYTLLRNAIKDFSTYDVA